jgi:type IV secretory pathway TrbF-like protein
MSSPHAHPYVDAVGTTAHHDRYLNLARGKWHWQITAWVALAVVAVQAAALAYMYGQRKEYAYAVQIDELGIASYVKELAPQPIHTPYLVAAQVGNFLRGIRTITTDPVAFKNGMNAAYAVCLKDAQGYIKRYYDAEKPLELIAQGGGVYPDRIDVTPLSDTSYRARWVERLVKGGEVLSETQWEATVQVVLTPPAELNQDQRQRNPLGVWVATLTWSKL